jgi:hypothetical protein
MRVPLLEGIVQGTVGAVADPNLGNKTLHRGQVAAAARRVQDH